MGEIAQYSKTRILADKVNDSNYVGVDNLLPDKKGKTVSSCVPTNGSIIAYNKNNILIGNIRPYLKKIWIAEYDGGTNGDVLVVQINAVNLIVPKYLYYVLSSDNFFLYDMQNAKGAKMPRGNKNAILKYQIPVPSIEEQKRIVDILDRFDKLCNDISEGLPAEIELRKKQYEYYRDKLLTFERANVV